MALPREQRAIVSKLAAFLRVADAIMQGMGANSSGVELVREKDNLKILYSSDIDPVMIRKLLLVQGRLFEDLYGINIVPEAR